VVFAVAQSVVDIAAARQAVTVEAMAVMAADIGEATDIAAATVMDAGTGAALDSDLDSAIPGTAAITAIRTHTDIHTTGAVIIQTRITPIPTRMRRIPTAIPVHSSSMGLLRNNSSMANNLMGRHRIRNKAIRLSNRTVIRSSSGTAIRHLRRPMVPSRIPRPIMRRHLSRRPTTIGLTASGIALAIPVLSS
jgi:hypothetical protein